MVALEDGHQAGQPGSDSLPLPEQRDGRGDQVDADLDIGLLHTGVGLHRTGQLALQEVCERVGHPERRHALMGATASDDDPRRGRMSRVARRDRQLRRLDPVDVAHPMPHVHSHQPRGASAWVAGSSVPRVTRVCPVDVLCPGDAAIAASWAQPSGDHSRVG